MGIVSTWLTGCGLQQAIPNFTAAGIVTPDALAELDLAHYEALGISSPEDRRKLFYLVQRIKLAVKKEREEESTTKTTTSLEDQVDAVVIQSTTTTGLTELSSTTKEKDPAASLAVEKSQSRGESSEQQIASTTPTKQKKSPLKSSPSKIPAPSTKRSPSRLTPPKSTAIASTKQNSAAAANMATSPGETTTPRSKSPRSMALEASADEGVDDDDEASASIRRSKRIAQKDTTTSSTIPPQSQSPIKVTKPTTKGTLTTKPTSKSTNTQPAPKKSGPSTSSITSRRASSGLKTPQPKSKAGLQSQQNRNNSNKALSSLPQPSRLSSKLQNPSKSMRTGKQLSTIPSDDILPMSPMIPPKLDTDERQPKKPNLVQPKKSLSRRSLGGNTAKDVSDSEASDTESVGGGSSRRSRSRRTTLDYSSNSSRLSRSTGGNMSDSDSSVNSSKRRRSLGVPAITKTKITHKLAKGRVSDVVSTSRRQASTGTARSHNSTVRTTSTGQSVLQTKKSSMSIHGGTDPEASFKAQIEALRQEVAMEHELFSDAIFQDDDDDDDHMIRVIVRKRPFNKHKSSDIDVIHPLEYGYYGKMLVYQPMTRVDLTKEINKIPFSFDSVFDEKYDNSQIYDKSVRNMIPVVLDGQHATVFAFGATGSGKTHTMMGSNFTGNKVVEDSNMGLYYMAALDVFQCLDDPEYSHLSVGVSLYEIYGGKLFDLLNNRRAVKCLEDHQGKVQFPGLSEHSIHSPPELIELIELGAQSRSTGTTSRNADSSRSHAVLQLHLRKTVGRKSNVEHGRLTFIDLAGSERGADTANFSRATRLEGAEINTSLLALKEVIRARARGGSMVHVPFRGSKLTQVLKESFVGENSRCLMIACIAPDMDNCEQTLNTLRYADRVKERNPETGALPAKFVKRGGRRRTSMLKSSTSISSIVSASDQSSQAKYDKRTRKIGTATMKPVEMDGFSEDSFSDSRSSMKESEPEVVRKSNANRSRPKIATHKSHEVTIAHPEEDETDALLDAVLSEDAGSLVSDNEVAQSNSLVDELIATHDSFLKAVMGMVQEEIDVLGKLKEDSNGVEKYSSELEVMLTSSSSLISDIRECFQSYESLSIGKELQSLNTVLTGLLEIVNEEISIVKALDCGNNLEALEALQERKISKLAVLEAVFSSGQQAEEPKSTSDVLLSESFRSEGDDDDLSAGSFEDLRV